MRPLKVLIVDDEPAIEKMLQPYFAGEGIVASGVSNGLAALESAEAEHPDVILLDLQMPGMAGLEVLKALRQRKDDAFIIVLTGRADEIDRILGLELGADDYVTKPFSPREVVARVKAAARRLKRTGTPRPVATHNEDDWIVAGDVTIDLRERTVTLGKREVLLTPTEFRLLQILAADAGRAFSRAELLDRIDNDALEVSERSLDTHVAHLRAKLEEGNGKPRYIETVYGHGYKFKRAIART